MLFLQKPRYYDAPDGHAPIDKVVAMSKKGLIAGIAAGAWDSVYITQTKNASQTVNCMAYWIVPSVSMAAMWASVTYMSTKFRGKDDYVNYIIGAAACAPIFYAWRKNTEYALWGTTVLMVAAFLAKHSREHGWKPLPELHHLHMYGNYMYDMTLTKKYDKDFERTRNQFW